MGGVMHVSQKTCSEPFRDDAENHVCTSTRPVQEGLEGVCRHDCESSSSCYGRGFTLATAAGLECAASADPASSVSSRSPTLNPLLTPLEISPNSAPAALPKLISHDAP